MKKVILFSAILFAMSAKGQTIDTTIAKPYAVVKLATPFATSWQDTTKARCLNVAITSDNLKDAATFRWLLLGANNKIVGVGDVVKILNHHLIFVTYIKNGIFIIK